MYIGNNRETYGDLEESILACILIEPTNIERLIVDERHFRKFGYILTFLKEFYAKHKCLDISLMFSTVKSGSEMTLLDTITYLLDIFVIPTHFYKYQSELLSFYSKTKKEDWLRRKIYEKATQLYVGRIDLYAYNVAIDKLYREADRIVWK